MRMCGSFGGNEFAQRVHTVTRQVRCCVKNIGRIQVVLTFFWRVLIPEHGVENCKSFGSLQALSTKLNADPAAAKPLRAQWET